MLEEITRQIEGHTICALGDAAAWPVQVRAECGDQFALLWFACFAWSPGWVVWLGG
jgi:hypothetical protein